MNDVVENGAADAAREPERTPDRAESLTDLAREAAADHPELQDVLRRLDRIDEVDLEHRPAEFDEIHRVLRAALTDASEPRPGTDP